MSLKIIGAGMAGLLAANLLRHHDPVVIEAQDGLPNNHSAVLRFRTPAIGDLLGIPFRRVKMQKCHVEWENPVADAMAYARKTTGISRSDRSIASAGIAVHDRYVAPPDFISLMARNVKIEFCAKWDFDASTEKVISTIPMPALMSLLRYPREKRPDFQYVHGYNIRALVPKCDAHVSVYVPDPDYGFSRVSITGNELIVEYSFPGASLEEVRRMAEGTRKGTITTEVHNALSFLGLRGEVASFPQVMIQRYAKIIPVDDQMRRGFIFWASTVQRKAFQLGRFATWRPGLMMEDLIKDIRLIDAWIGAGDGAGYAQDIHEAEKRSPALAAQFASEGKGAA